MMFTESTAAPGTLSPAVVAVLTGGGSCILSTLSVDHTYVPSSPPSSPSVRDLAVGAVGCAYLCFTPGARRPQNRGSTGAAPLTKRPPTSGRAVFACTSWPRWCDGIRLFRQIRRPTGRFGGYDLTGVCSLLVLLPS
jgi:hypothetical protein